jgi:hypothetical protein
MCMRALVPHAVSRTLTHSVLLDTLSLYVAALCGSAWRRSNAFQRCVD